MPLRQTLRLDVTSALKGPGARADGTSRPARLRGRLIGLQAAVSLVLLAMAVLLTRGMTRASAIDVGFDANRLLSVSPALGREMSNEVEARFYWDAALERVSVLPSVAAATLSDQSPFRGSNVTIFRRAGVDYTLFSHHIHANYFATIGLPLLRGRTFTSDEIATEAAVSVVSEKVARDFYTGEGSDWTAVE